MMNCWYFEDYPVMVISESPIEDFDFNKTLGKIKFRIIANAPDSCRVIISKWLLDGAFNFFVNNALVACPVSWNSEGHIIDVAYTQGTHSFEIMAEYTNPCIPDFPDINRDCIIDIFDVVLVSKNFGKTLEDL